MKKILLLVAVLIPTLTFGQVDTIQLDDNSRLLFSESPITDTAMVFDLQSVTVTATRLDPKQPITNEGNLKGWKGIWLPLNYIDTDNIKV